MSATTITPALIAHCLIIKRDSRGRGSYHAAIPVRDEAGHWRTACGEELIPTRISGGAYAAAIIAAPDAPLCARCDRVGRAL